MAILGYLLLAVAKVVGLITNIYTFIVIISALISWVNPDPMNPIVQILRRLTEPAFDLVRKILPAKLRSLPIDISPIVVLLILTIIETTVVGVVQSVAIKMM